MKKVLIVLSVICIIFAFSACSSKEFVDVVVTAPVTDKNGETVTDKSGKAVTEIVTDKNGNNVTQSVGKSQTKANDIVVSESANIVSQSSSEPLGNTADSKSTEKAGNSNTSAPKDNESKTEKNTKKDNSTNTTSEKTTKKETANKTTEKTTNKTTEKENEKTTEKETTTEATTKSKKRDITVNVKLPYYNDIESEIKVSYRVVGDKKFKQLDAEEIVLDGKTVKTSVIKKIKGDVEIVVTLKGVSLTANTQTVAASDEDQEITMIPATGIEAMNGEDD